MQSNIEIEAKVLLEKDEFKKLVSKLHLERYKKIKQINHYVDTTDRTLKENDLALRVRETDEFVLTLKTPLSEGLLEKNQVISWRDYADLEDDNSFPAGDIKNFLEICGFNVRELKVLATLTTYRIEIEYEDGLLCLDENYYGKDGSIVDYEVEVEANSIARAEEIMKKVLQEGSIKEFKFNKRSKQTRAISAI